MTEQQVDLDAPYVPEGAYVPQVGDKVRFRMGERIGQSCVNCGFINLDAGESIKRHSGSVFMIFIVGRRNSTESRCAKCEFVQPFIVAPYRYAIDASGNDHESGDPYGGIWVCANELTLIKKGNDNE